MHIYLIAKHFNKNMHDNNKEITSAITSSSLFHLTDSNKRVTAVYCVYDKNEKKKKKKFRLFKNKFIVM